MTDTPAPTSSRPAPGDPCPCGSGQAFSSCCEPLLKGVTKASTAELLMRSRYTAHAVEDFEYLHNTYVPTCDTDYEEEEYEATIKWTKLVIHGHEPDVRPGISHVDFSAYFTEKDRQGVMHEKSEFILRDGNWLFNKPLREGPAPVKAGPKVGRNDPCPCGSGKKFKKCCG